MPSAQYHSQVDAILKAIPSLGGRIYDTYVPDALPTDHAGYVLPYVLIASGIPTDLGDPGMCDKTDMTAHEWRAQTNCVGPSPSHARACAQLVANALTDAKVGNHWLKPNPDAFRAEVPIKDEGVEGRARFFMPLFWRLTTTT